MKTNANKTTAWFFVIAMGSSIISVACYGQANSNTPASLPKVMRPSLAWASSPWTDDNLPYYQVRIGIDNAYAQKKIDAKTLDEYRSQYLKSKQPALAYFRWSYASYVGSKQKPPINQDPDPSPLFYGEPPAPHSYDYARLRFLVEAPSEDQRLIPLGRRLINKNPKDFDVKYALVNFYDPLANGMTKREALNYANQLLVLYPEEIKTYALIGGVYYKSWLEKKSPTTGKRSAADGAKAVYFYQKYLQLAPKDDSFRKHAELLISDIQSPKF